MEAPLTPIFKNIKISNPNNNEILETKKYELKLNTDTYILIIEMYSTEEIHFKAYLKNNLLSTTNFSNVFTYEELIKKLILPKEHYSTISKVFTFYDISLS